MNRFGTGKRISVGEQGTKPRTFPPYGAGYDIHVTVSVDGVSSNPFPVFLDTPYTMTASDKGVFCTGSGCNCNAEGYIGYYGYANYVKHFIADLVGTTLVPIITNESLEKQQWLNSTYQSAGFHFPQPTNWDPSITGDWNGDNSFSDLFLVCSATESGLSPPLETYNPNGTSQIENQTQKFWVGSATQFHGVCVQRGVVTEYTDHGVDWSPLLRQSVKTPLTAR